MSSVAIHFCSPKKVTYFNDNNDIKIKLEKLCELRISNDSMKKWNCNLVLNDLLCGVAFEKLSPPKKTLADEIMAFLQEICCDKFSSQRIENHFFLSYKYLESVFKKATNRTMQQYHTGLEMQEAKRLLRSTVLTISDISEVVGFSDRLYFSKCFRQQTGISPSQYRKKSFTI